ncbi:Hypothetical predicted protein [Prunus dulcis]|uniref:Uncharacterized protein n=1 Tax=Prunus dulcis TaxID=3755 RepID=A0A5E4GDU7_PRUDU|nr:Hypothetical predicted protein [Prunus dulcis]
MTYRLVGHRALVPILIRRVQNFVVARDKQNEGGVAQLTNQERRRPEEEVQGECKEEGDTGGQTKENFQEGGHSPRASIGSVTTLTMSKQVKKALEEVMIQYLSNAQWTIEK